MARKTLRVDFFGLVKEKEQAEQRDITNREISEATGISEHAIGRWRKNKVGKFSIEQLESILNYFDCYPNDLLIREESEPA